MQTDVFYPAAPTAVTVDKVKFDEMVQSRILRWGSLAQEVSQLYPVDGCNPELFAAAKRAVLAYRRGDRTRDNLLAMGRGWADWYLTCQEKEGRVVYERGQKNAA